MVEQIAGVGYVAMVVSRLVGLTVLGVTTRQADAEARLGRSSETEALDERRKR